MALKKKAKKKVTKRKPVKSAKKKILRKVTKKKSIKRKPAKKSISKKRPIAKTKPKEKPVGIITHYFPHVRAAVIKLKAPLLVGSTIKIKGHTTDFKQTISSMQIDHAPVNQAKIGQEIGLLVDSRVRQHDLVYKV